MFRSNYSGSKKMKNVQISDNDLVGNRFNGHDLHFYLIEKGINSKQLVWMKHSNDPNTFEIAENFTDRHKVNSLIHNLEQELLVHSLFYPFSYQLLFDKHFLETDIVHYHLIHNYFFSIAMLPLLSKLKPSVWSLHDPWAMTGHCIHPFDCERWKTRCGDCPRLDTEFVMRKDNTALNWEMKRLYYHNSDIDIVVASKWMLNMAKQSPLLSRFRLHHIPYGINLNIFRPMDTLEAKAQLGISSNTLVLAFRAITWKLKGLHFIKELLHKLQPNQPICLLSFNDKGLMDEFNGKYQIIDLGWVDNDQQMVYAYNAADIFLMPSLAEGFGLMAVEAMACGKPVIIFEGTALSEAVHTPEGGIAVPIGNCDALLQATERLIDNPEERQIIGRKALELARKYYNVKNYVDSIIALYQEVIDRRTNGTRSTYLVSQLKAIELEKTTIMPMEANTYDSSLQTELNLMKAELNLIKSSNSYRIMKKLSQIKIIRLVYFKMILPVSLLLWRVYKK
jgi:glycosyltransferase involved in cell wall biosynthesis